MKKTILICIGLVLGFFIFPSENVDAKKLSEPTSYVCYDTFKIGPKYLAVNCNGCKLQRCDWYADESTCTK